MSIGVIRHPREFQRETPKKYVSLVRERIPFGRHAQGNIHSMRQLREGVFGVILAPQAANYRHPQRGRQAHSPENERSRHNRTFIRAVMPAAL
jgi:hypothetical protein